MWTRTRSKQISSLGKSTNERSSDTESDSSDEIVEELALNAFGQMRSLILNNQNETSDDDDDDEKDVCDGKIDDLFRYAIDKKGEIDNTACQLCSIDLESSGTDDSGSEELDPEPAASSQSKSQAPKERNDDLMLSSSLQPAVDLDNLYVNTDIYSGPKLMNKNITELLMNPQKTELLQKSVLTSDFEKKSQILPYTQGLHQLKKRRRLEREKTNGRGWFNMPAPDLTEEKKNDLLVIQMRRALDPKRFYKGPDRKGLPKYFQTGCIIESAADFYHSRIPKKQRKETIVDEMLADVELKRYNKKKYQKIMEAKMRSNRGAFKHMRRQKKRK